MAKYIVAKIKGTIALAGSRAFLCLLAITNGEMIMATENSTETPTSNAGIQITIDEKVLDAIDRVHEKVTNAGLLMHCDDYLEDSNMKCDVGSVCLVAAKYYLDNVCEDLSTISDAIGWSYDDRRKRQGGAS